MRLMFDIRQKLNAPYPLTSRDLSYKEVLRVSIFLTAFLIIINLLGGEATEHLLVISIFIGSIPVALFLNVLIVPALFPAHFIEQRWVVWKELIWILFNFISIAGFAFVIFTIIGLSPFTLSQYAVFLGTTFAYGLGPVIIIIIYRQNSLLKQHLKVSRTINASEPKYTDKPEAGLIKIKSSVGVNHIIIDRKSLLYFEASKNNVLIYVNEHDQLIEKSIRSTLKMLEEQLSEYPEFIRCHRAFILNTHHVYQVTGNAQGLKITLKGSNISVPVSRRYIGSFKDKMQ